MECRPIDKLTPELFGMVFLELMRINEIMWESKISYLYGVCAWYSARLRLLLVSKEWNQLVVNFPLLWVDIRGNVRNLDLMLLCLQRSAQAGIYVEVSLFDPYEDEVSERTRALALVLFTTICDMAPKWRWVRFRYNDNFIPVFPPFLNGRLSQLARMDMQYLVAPREMPLGKEFGSSVFASAPHLRFVTIRGQTELFRLPPHLEYLFLVELETPISLAMRDVVYMRNLRILSLNAASHNVFLEYSGLKATFPCLTAFTLEFDWLDIATDTHRNAIAKFFSHLDTPVLDELTLMAGEDMEVFQGQDGAGTCVHDYLCRLPVLRTLYLFSLDVGSQDLIAWLSVIPSLTGLIIRFADHNPHNPLQLLFQKLCSSKDDDGFLPLLNAIRLNGIASGDTNIDTLTSIISARGKNRPGLAQLRTIEMDFNCGKGDLEGSNRLYQLKEVVNRCREKGLKIWIGIQEEREDFPDMDSEDFWDKPPMKDLV